MRDVITTSICAILLIILSLMTLSSAKADGEWLPGHPRIYTGISYDLHDPTAPECHQSRWIGTFGAEHDLYRNGDSRVVAAYRHNSCLNELRDRGISDSVGLRWVYTID